MTKLTYWLLAATLAVALPVWSAPAPDFSLSGSSGTVSLSQLRGEVVYLDFWASWCVPCRKSFPWMNEMQARYGKQGLKIVAINLDKDQSLARRFLDQQKPTFAIAYDPSGDTAERFNVMGMPSSFLIDGQGNVIRRHVGFRDADREKLEESIEELIAQQGGS